MEAMSFFWVIAHSIVIAIMGVKMSGFFRFVCVWWMVLTVSLFIFIWVIVFILGGIGVFMSFFPSGACVVIFSPTLHKRTRRSIDGARLASENLS